MRNCTYDVIGLEPNKKYNFRVRAENQYGVSEPIEMDSPITAKFPFTVPDPPGQPQIMDWDSNNASLMWERPRSDGGARIQGYKVEFRFVPFYNGILSKFKSKKTNGVFCVFNQIDFLHLFF